MVDCKNKTVQFYHAYTMMRTYTMEKIYKTSLHILYMFHGHSFRFINSLQYVFDELCELLKPVSHDWCKWQILSAHT